MQMRLLIIVCGLMLAAPHAVSGELLRQSYNIENIRHIEAGQAATLEIRQGSTESLRAEATAEVLERVTVHVKGERLILGVKSKKWGFWSWFGSRGNDRVKFVIQVSELSGLQLSGASRAQVDDLRTRNLRVDISGASRAEFGSLEVAALILKVSGSSRAKIDQVRGETLAVDASGASRLEIQGEGRVNELVLNISGASRYQGSALEAERAKVEASGASRAELGVIEFLNANASGASNISYRGSPQIRQKTSGAGNIHLGWVLFPPGYLIWLRG